jgi:glycosyltransferase involved in cell wall biosynthesis
VLIEELLAMDLNVSAFTLTDEVPPSRAGPIVVEGPKFRLHICRARRHAFRPNGLLPGRAIDLFWYERRELSRAMRAARPDVIHAHWCYEYAGAALSTGVPTLITCHDAPQVIARIAINPYRWFRYVLARRVLASANHLTTVSPYMAEQLRPLTALPIAVVPNPLGRTLITRSLPRSAPTTRRIAIVSNGWDRLKNQATAIKAFHRFHKAQTCAELHLFGADLGISGRAQQWCERRGFAAGVVFHGAIPRERLLDALTGMDLLVHPSIEESFGMAVAEAMALGLPVVAGTLSGAVPWVLGRDNNSPAAELLCDVRDERAISSMIDRAFDARYEVRSDAGRADAARRFDVRTVTAQYLQIYRSLLRVTFGEGAR